MGLKFRMQFLLFVLYAMQIQNTNCMKRFLSSKSKKIDFSETTDIATARLIYIEHGIGDKDHLCKSVDGKTSRMNAYSVCKQAAEKLKKFGQRKDENISEREVKCVFEDVNLGYEHAEKYQKLDFIGPSTGEIYKSTHKRHQMAYCGDLNEQNSFYLIYANPNYSYVFVGKKKVGYRSIEGCLNLQPPMSDHYPLVKIEETENFRTADNIFGSFGVSEEIKSKNDAAHVCYKRKNSKTILGDEICPFALEKCKLRPILNAKVSCVSRKLTRYTGNGCIFPSSKKKSFDVAECFYSDKNNPKSLLIINGPKKGYYYAAKSWDGKDYFVTNVFQYPPLSLEQIVIIK